MKFAPVTVVLQAVQYHLWGLSSFILRNVIGISRGPAVISFSLKL